MPEIQNQWYLRKAEEAQLAADPKNSNLFHQTIKEIYGPQQSIFASFKSKDGHTTLTQPKDIQARWCEYYTELLNQLLMNLCLISSSNGNQLSLLMKYLLGTKLTCQ